jgi:hypothetical protein
LAGQEFRIEGIIEQSLPMLASQGNWAARNALEIDGYTIDHAPFYYGKVGSLGYVLSEKDIGIKPKTTFVMPKY